MYEFLLEFLPVPLLGSLLELLLAFQMELLLELLHERVLVSAMLLLENPSAVFP